MPKLTYCNYHRTFAAECGGTHGEAPRGVNTECPIDPAGEHQWEDVFLFNRQQPVKSTCALCGANRSVAKAT